jgi:MFS family permease
MIQSIVGIELFRIRRHFPPNVTALGLTSALTAMSSAMIYGLLPVFLIRVLGVSMASVGFIEGIAEAANSLVKIISGAASDWLGRRKPLVVFGYSLSAIIKTLFPIAEAASTVLIGRTVDRLGKGIRDAPRDALLADVIEPAVRGSGFGWRLALAIIGFVLGPAVAIALMWLSGDNFRLVFWIALVPAYLSVLLLWFAVKELPNHHEHGARLPLRRQDLTSLPKSFWWMIAIAALLSLARFSQAFLVLKMHDIGVDAAFVPMTLIVTFLVYSATAYPFGILADNFDRRLQLALGAVILVAADVVLATAGTVWPAALGAALWGLHLGATQGLFGSAIADAAPEHLRGTAFGIYDLAAGVATFAASAGAGVLWTVGGPTAAFGTGACIAAAAAVALLLRPMPPDIDDRPQDRRPLRLSRGELP